MLLYNGTMGNYEEKVCAKSKHALYLPTDDPKLRAKLYFQSNNNEFVRCLRCGNFTNQDFLTIPRAQIPLVIRGSHSRKYALLKLIAIERFLKGIVLILISLSFLNLSPSKNTWGVNFKNLINASIPLAHQLGFTIEDSVLVEQIDRLLTLSNKSYLNLSLIFGLYALLSFFEGVSLWLAKRWGEYIVFFFTSLFIPLELYEILKDASILKIATLIFNLLILAYLLYKGRLFNFRGGHDGFLQELTQGSLLSEIELEITKEQRT